MVADPNAHRIPQDGLETIKLCVASAWVHGTIPAERAYELADMLGCSRGELAVFAAEVMREQGHNG